MKRTVEVEVRSNERVLVLDDEELDFVVRAVHHNKSTFGYGGVQARLARKVDDIR